MFIDLSGRLIPLQCRVGFLRRTNHVYVRRMTALYIIITYIVFTKSYYSVTILSGTASSSQNSSISREFQRTFSGVAVAADSYAASAGVRVLSVPGVLYVIYCISLIGPCSDCLLCIAYTFLCCL